MEDLKSFKGSKTNYIWIRDDSGNEYLCPSSALQNPNRATEQELAGCVSDLIASVNPRGG